MQVENTVHFINNNYYNVNDFTFEKNGLWEMEEASSSTSAKGKETPRSPTRTSGYVQMPQHIISNSSNCGSNTCCQDQLLNVSKTLHSYAKYENSTSARAYEPRLRKHVKKEPIQFEGRAFGDSIESEKKEDDSAIRDEDALTDCDTCDSPMPTSSGPKRLCPMGHELRKEEAIDCKTCIKRHISLQKFALKNKGKLISERYGETLTFECESGHRWDVSYKR